MGRWADEDSDVERLPEGFQRIGYDADTSIYTFRDENGTIYESEPGNRYGPLYPSGQRPQRSASEISAHNSSLKQGKRESIKMMLPFALLVLVFLLLLFRYLGGSGGSADEVALQVHCAKGYQKVEVKTGDTCWQIGDEFGVSVDELVGFEGNEEVDCERLQIGQKMCVPN